MIKYRFYPVCLSVSDPIINDDALLVKYNESFKHPNSLYQTESVL